MKGSSCMFLKSVEIMRDRIEDDTQYPYTIPAIQNLNKLYFDRAITFFVGENGAGKSTLLEAIADNIGFNTAGGSKQNYQAYEVHASESDLAESIRLAWLPKVTEGFFLRAETFFSFASHLDQTDTTGYRAYGGKSLHEQSHGESFFSLFANRFKGNAIYLLDEPEAALSPSRQLAFLRILHDLTSERNVQFIIATHSPILLGFPNAQIYSFDGDAIEEVDYEQTSHYQVTSYFLGNREKMLRELFKDDEEE